MQDPKDMYRMMNSQKQIQPDIIKKAYTGGFMVGTAVGIGIGIVIMEIIIRVF